MQCIISLALVMTGKYRYSDSYHVLYSPYQLAPLFVD